MARILGHSKVRRELNKLAARSAQTYIKALGSVVPDDDQTRELMARAYREGFWNGVETADKINERRSQYGR